MKPRSPLARRTPPARMSDKRRSQHPELRYSTVSRSRRPIGKNAKRRASEFARCYHSRERVRFVKSLGCVACTAIHPAFGLASAGKSDNAHTENGGRGRKGPYASIVPLCRSHHHAYDEHRAPLFNQPVIREAFKRAAAVVEEKWQIATGARLPESGA